MKKFLHFLIFSILLFSCYFSFTTTSLAQSSKDADQVIEARVTEVLEEEQHQTLGSDHLYQKLKLHVYKGSLKDKEIIVTNGELPLANLQKYKVNDRLIISCGQDLDGQDFFQIIDSVRRDSLLLLFILFLAITLVVARFYGFSSLLATAFSFLIIFKIILPQIIKGTDPILISVITSLIIIPVTFYLSHGFNLKTNVAILSTFFALLATALLATVFVELAKLTGLSSEEAAIVKSNFENTINMKGLILSGIMLASLGALDDITIAQAGIVAQLSQTMNETSFIQLYKRAMAVGRDHITSMVNTLILVYTGASLPLLLLFVDNPHPFAEIINYEFIAEEVVRTLVASIGLVLAVPLSTVLASIFYLKRKNG
ncbi:hypothetical protein DRH14_01785 [Candidatus Shapirobacteria bacterium]|nr:MAG: hypothetical protein DRH14_01785 [Candidatus Shapirobacteria bacterium]